MKIKKKASAIEATLTELAALVPSCASALLDVLQADLRQRPEKAALVSSIEEDADDRHLRLVREVGSTFITPFDREDLFDLLEDLDDIIDDIDLASRTCASLTFPTVPAPIIASAEAIVSMAALMSDAVHLVKEPERLVETLVAANGHYAEVRRQYVVYLADALQDDKPVMEALRGKVLADQMESIAGELESFGRSLGVMAIKET